MFRAVVLLAVILAVMCASAAAQALSTDEQKLASYIDAHQQDQIALLERVVNLQSPTENLRGVRQVGMVFKAQLEALGLRAKWIEMPPAMKRAGHLVAQTNGAKGKRILLLGHIDTVLGGEKFRREGNRAFGSGTVDMKAGDLVLLYALKALDSIGALKDTRIIVVLTGDEETAGRPIEISRRDVVDAAKNSDLALSFEAAAGTRATVGRRGSSNWTLEVAGQTGHSAGIFQDDAGAGAIFEAARIINQFYDALHKEKYLTFNPSVIVGGTTASLDVTSGTASGKSNVIPAKVLVSGDLRFLSEKQKEEARAKMREIVARNLPRTSAKITFEDRYPAMTPNDGNYAVLKQLDQVSRDMGGPKVEALDPSQRGAGDIAFVSHLIPGLDGIGAAGGGAHAPGEFVELDSLPMLTKRAAILIYRLTR
ncbi:MAG TPA: M20/M25/M40 family metallo-hydrolase [Pyrinomonadaceae bacterium]|nr:M20/M25/M40 family metallo-hydrolase [Pyrinomonadaceae bacterium]